MADQQDAGDGPGLELPMYVGRPTAPDRERFLELVGGIFDRRWLTNDGPLVQELERRLAAHLGVEECVAVVNGTVGLEMVARALSLRGEVIVPSFSFVATAHALSWQGIRPVFADIDPATHNLSPEAVRDAITSDTTAILGVHLWGRPAPTEQLQQIADEHDLQLVFDAAHAFGVRHRGRPVGTFGAAEVFSFHATKFFNSFEGGAITTADADLAAKLRLMRNFGFDGYDHVVLPGTNGKMTEICAAMGLTNLESLPAVTSANAQTHARYAQRLAELPSFSLVDFTDVDSPNYQYAVVELDGGRAEERDDLVAFLHERQIIARRYFWPGIHRMQPYETADPDTGRRLPNTSLVADRVVVLPTGPSVGMAGVDYVCDAIAEWQKGQIR